MNIDHPQRNKFLWLVGFLVVVVVAIVVAKMTMPKTDKPVVKEQNEEKKNDTKPAVSITEIPKDKIPDKMPSNLPIESDAKITQNYSAVQGQSFQYTRAYETKKSIVDVRKSYQDYFAKNGWKVVATLDDAGLKVFTAVKDELQMQVSMSDSTISKLVLVEITVTANPNSTK